MKITKLPTACALCNKLCSDWHEHKRVCEENSKTIKYNPQEKKPEEKTKKK